MPVTLSNFVNRFGTTGVFRKFMNSHWYPFLTRRLDSDDVVFLNYGYEEDPPMNLPLAPSDEPDRFGIQLYQCTAGQVNLSDKDVLEVSCGHGGGASYIVRTLHPASYTGLDFNADGIAYCQNRHQLPGLEFVHGDALSLPFGDESFDAVINVEASHAYPRLHRFLAEVERVLRPGGHFLYTDFRGNDEVAAWDKALENAPLRMSSRRDINREVVRGMEMNAQRSLDLIGRHLPPYLRPFGRRFAGVPGSGIHRDLERQKICYRIYSFTKDDHAPRRGGVPAENRAE